MRREPEVERRPAPRPGGDPRVLHERAVGTEYPNAAVAPVADRLAGPGFVARWSTRSLGELFDYMRSVMPLNSPGGLSAQQNADLLAFMLRRANYPPEAKELPASTEALDPIALAARP